MIETKTYTIIQEPKTNSYTLRIKNGSTYEIYKSITETNILSNIFFDDENNIETIMFTAEKVKPLSLFLKEGKLTNRMAIKMAHDLSKQIAYLEGKLFAFYGYDLDDILVINNDIFIIACVNHLLKIDPDNSIYFYTPIEKPYFSNPEIIKLTKLPAKIDYRSGYYSLGALILFCLTNIYIFAELKEELKEEEKDNLNDILEPIYYTKMYWFIKRCFHEKGEERIILFI